MILGRENTDLILGVILPMAMAAASMPTCCNQWGNGEWTTARTGFSTAVAVMILIAPAWLGGLVAVMVWERFSLLWELSDPGQGDFIPDNVADLAIVVLKTAILLIWSSTFLAVGMLADTKGRSIAGWLTDGILALPLLPAVLLCWRVAPICVMKR